jgi:hypothetical protein
LVAAKGRQPPAIDKNKIGAPRARHGVYAGDRRRSPKINSRTRRCQCVGMPGPRTPRPRIRGCVIGSPPGIRGHASESASAGAMGTESERAVAGRGVTCLQQQPPGSPQRLFRIYSVWRCRAQPDFV